MMLIPRVKEIRNDGGILNVGEVISCESCNDIELFATEYLKEILGNKFSESKNTNLVFKECSEYKSEEYSIEISDIITIWYSDKLSVRNAISTLIQLLSVKDEMISAKKCRVHDYPDCEYRSVMIDLARGLPDMVRLKEDLLRLALVKCRYVHFHLMDTMGLCYVSEVFPRKEPIRGTQLYTVDTLKEIVAYCDKLGMEAIPEIEVPSHANAIVEFFPNLKCKTQLENQSTAVVCVGNEETYSFYEKLIDEISGIFQSQYFHVGGDELYFNDFPEWNWHCHWLECSDCQKMMAKNNLKTIQDAYYYVMRRIKKILDKKGKKMVMFNDEINIAENVDLPKDIIIQFWRVANKDRGPRKGCSFEGFAKNGFQVINSDFLNCYFDLEQYANSEKLSWFEYDKIPDCKEEYRDNIIGAEACYWEYGNPNYRHYIFSFFYASALFMDKLWDKRSVVYTKKYRKSLTKILIGPNSDEKLDVSDLFGSILPPRRNDILSYVNKNEETIDEEDYKAIMEILKSIPDTYSKYYLSRLITEFSSL